MASLTMTLEGLDRDEEAMDAYLRFADLEVTMIPPGFAPFVVPASGPDAKFPLD